MSDEYGYERDAVSLFFGVSHGLLHALSVLYVRGFVVLFLFWAVSATGP